MPAICVVGDPDNHGGAITSGDSKVTVNGIPVACISDTVSSDPIPGHSGKTLVSSGTSGKTTAGGKVVVCTGGGVSCGATVTATNSKSSCS